jgi:glycosyltransferase involved in cell wall biosynthesis
MKSFLVGLLFLMSVPGFAIECLHHPGQEKPFVILITSYNNELYAQENILSALNQHYSNYRIIFINDVSTDHTLELVEKTIKEQRAEHKVKIINNTLRKLGLRNYYEVITNETKDEEIIVCLDGDDFLTNKHVLCVLNAMYSHLKKEIWLTYGQFVHLNSKIKGWNRKIDKEVIEHNSFRELAGWCPTHLKTFYSWLFKRICLEDLLYEGRFFEMTWDQAIMFPMLEMSRGRFAFIDKLLYYYNDQNLLSDYRVDHSLLVFYGDHIRHLKRYKPLPHSPYLQCNCTCCPVCNAAAEIYE